jgi:hypothetical protein
VTHGYGLYRGDFVICDRSVWVVAGTAGGSPGNPGLVLLERRDDSGQRSWRDPVEVTATGECTGPEPESGQP